MTTLQEAARKALACLELYDHEDLASCEARHELRTALAQQGEPVCHGCGIPAGDVHMSTCKSGKWPSRVSNGDTAAPAPQPSQGAVTRRKIFVCAHCDGIYADQTVTQCDCMEGTGADFVEGFAEYPAALQSAHPVAQPAQDVPEVGFGNMPYSPYLFGGLRFKMNFDKSGNATNFHGVESALQGAWVALVDATDNRHLQSAQPVARPLTLEQLLDIVKKLGEPT